MTIGGYVFRADLYCPECIFQAVAGCPAPERIDTESALEALGVELGINRMEEATYDSDEFPKVVFRIEAERNDRCCQCGEGLRG